MNDFDYDSIQKKKLARQAFHRKGPHGRKGITLRQDNMTASQLRKENGPIVEYKLHEPMKWKQFRGMPEDIQRTYVDLLRDKYHASISALSEMFGISIQPISALFPVTGKNHRMSAEQKAAWQAFLNGNSVTEIENDEIAEPDEVVEETPAAEEEPVVEEEPIIEEPAPKKRPTLHQPSKANAEVLALKLCGSAEEILGSLQMALSVLNHGEDDTYTCSVRLEKVF